MKAFVEYLKLLDSSKRELLGRAEKAYLDSLYELHRDGMTVEQCLKYAYAEIDHWY